MKINRSRNRRSAMKASPPVTSVTGAGLGNREPINRVVLDFCYMIQSLLLLSRGILHVA